jgi:hypothetical protein
MTRASALEFLIEGPPYESSLSQDPCFGSLWARWIHPPRDGADA